VSSLKEGQCSKSGSHKRISGLQIAEAGEVAISAQQFAHAVLDGGPLAQTVRNPIPCWRMESWSAVGSKLPELIKVPPLTTMGNAQGRILLVSGAFIEDLA
jgi:hypothetical protein